MKKFKPIFIAAMIAALFAGEAFGQLTTNLAKVNITNKLLTRSDRYEFDLRLVRLDGQWERWANGTFQFTLSADSIDYSGLKVELLTDGFGNGFTDLGDLLAGPGDMRQSLPVDRYHITPEILPNNYTSEGESPRISITIAGPEEFDYAKDVPIEEDSADGILLGRFRISTKDRSELPVDLDINWLAPYDYYQACAYKRSKIDDEFYWHSHDPNIEMADFSLGTNVIYDKDNFVDTCFIVKNFSGEYNGEGLVTLTWETECEVQNEGFFIMRGLQPYGSDNINDIDFDREIGHYENSPKERAMLEGMGTAKPGKGYEFKFDSVEYRGEQYCYQLYNVDINGDVHFRAVTCVYIPNTIISFATAIPSVFNTKTQLKYRLEEDVYLTVFVTDLAGREVKRFYDNVPMNRGWHTELVFQPSEVAQQGLYDFIFIAKPREKMSVESARAIVKTQYVK